MKTKIFNEEKLEQFSGLLKPTFAAVEPARDQSIVLVVGATGDGKSTLLNYLSGSLYDPGENDLGNRSADLNPRSPKEQCTTGRNPQKSETRYPQVLLPSQGANPASFVYCDLPGFFDSRNEAEAICSAMAPQILNRCAGSVKGIVWVLSLNQFEVNKSEGIKKILKYLLDIASSNVDLIAESLMIVITKGNDKIKIDHILNRFQAVISNIEDPEQKKLLDKILNRIRNHPSQIIISDIFDHSGKNRELINTNVATLKERNTQDFDFSNYSPIQESFYGYLIDAAKLFMDNVLHIENQVQQKKANREKIARKKQKFSELDSQIAAHHLEQNALANQIKTLEKQIEAHQKTIGALEKNTFLKELTFNKPAEMLPGYHAMVCGPMDYNSGHAMTNRGNAIAWCYAKGYTHAEYNSSIYAVVPPLPKPGEATYPLDFQADYPVKIDKRKLNKEEILIEGTEQLEKGYQADVKYHIGKGLDICIVLEIEMRNTPEGKEKLRIEIQQMEHLMLKCQKLAQKKEALIGTIRLCMREQDQLESQLLKLQQASQEISTIILANQNNLKKQNSFFQSVYNMIVTLEIKADWVSAFAEFFNKEKASELKEEARNGFFFNANKTQETGSGEQYGKTPD